MSKKRYEWIFENGENEIIDNITGQYVTISSPELLNEKDQKIADLEAKLAENNESHHKNIVELTKMATEKDRKIEELKQQLANKENTICNLVEDNRASQEWYKKQLAEKEKEIAYMTKQAKKFNNEAQKYFEDAYCNDSIYQDKISFAVEQLEKVKECLYKIQSPIGEKPTLMDDGDVFEVINNQINVLRNNKDGIH